jgi:hypothetical protein
MLNYKLKFLSSAEIISALMISALERNLSL